MVSDAVKVASASLGNNFDITTTPLFQKDSSNKGRIPGMASNFMNKYLSTAQPADSSITKSIVVFIIHIHIFQDQIFFTLKNRCFFRNLCCFI